MTAISRERQHHLQALATNLATTWKIAGQIDAVTDGELPENRSEAYFVQDEIAGAIGDPLSGRKVGATSARMRELDGHDDVVHAVKIISARFDADLDVSYRYSAPQKCDLMPQTHL